ncbi:MAG: 16S rRNA methyltransferase GidB [uncultured bacterium]|jgi:16S rRNA (guanine527-N7)-methyltransferase|nr:MAG: 16S rRNA methyltransferase GidB [uncultured bacterium]
MTKNASAAKIEERWLQFINQDSLSQQELARFKTYAKLLYEWNQKFNITAVEEIPAIISHHFQDSLRLAIAIDISKISTLVDVGSGGGFPGIPLAIKHPHLKIILIEVSHKKIQFLEEVIGQLGLQDQVSIFDNDWRTFLRTTHFEVDVICARASLQPEELLRMFKPASPYKDALLVYWASSLWEPSDLVRPYIQEYVEYKVGNKGRRLAMLKR